MVLCFEECCLRLCICGSGGLRFWGAVCSGNEIWVCFD